MWMRPQSGYMSQETETETAEMTGTGLNDWQAGVVGGLIGGVVMGAIISMMNPATIAGAIAALYTLAPPPNGIAGWVAHMAHSAILGVVFAAIAAGAGFGGSVGRSTVAGLVWGFVLWVVAANIVMPIWLNAVGFPGGPALLGFALPGSLIPHLVYGVLLGVVYPFVRGR
jgi:hypothetical protein